MKAVTSEFALGQPIAPNLPLAPASYDQRYQDQLNNVMRLYLNRIDTTFNQLATSDVLPALVNYTVDTLPSAVTSGVGARSFVTNAVTPAFGMAVVGGGSVAVPVYSDGTNWIVG